jgi:hypothetical protein
MFDRESTLVMACILIVGVFLILLGIHTKFLLGGFYISLGVSAILLLTLDVVAKLTERNQK